MDKQKLIRNLVERAGVVEPLPDSVAASASAAILVFHGAHESSLDIFNQHGQEIGTAKRSRGRYSRDGYQYRYEVLGVHARFILTDVSKGRWISVPRDFTIAGIDGSAIASAHRYTSEGQPLLTRGDRPFSSWESFAFERDRETIGSLWKTPRKELRRARARGPASNPIGSLRPLYDRSFSSQLFYVEDQSGRQVARITYLSRSGVGYVLELTPGTLELLSTIAVAACIIADNAFISPPSGQ